MKFYLTIIIVLINALTFRTQGQDLLGVFREVDTYDKVIIYVEFKADSTVILRKANLKQADTIKTAFAAKGEWRLNKDTVILNFGRELQGFNFYNSSDQQIRLLIKDNATLYSRRDQNGKFVKDGLLKKGYKLVRLRPELLYEYNDLPN